MTYDHFTWVRISKIGIYNSILKQIKNQNKKWKRLIIYQMIS